MRQYIIGKTRGEKERFGEFFVKGGGINVAASCR